MAEAHTANLEAYGRHALVEQDTPAPVRPIARGRHRMQPPRKEGFPFLNTAIVTTVMLAAEADLPPTI
ncbi:MAG: hypothetical protein H0W89_04235 [Candidatus Levybacteria bacterium]|nr:hypothetical protein [Candidatus Levybacteria bacterium]